MKNGRITLQFLLLLVFGFLFATNAFAQATRTWISGVGDDANPCSRTAPCKTFAGAISKTAAGGTIDVLDPGGFGAITITKAITLEAIGNIAGILVSGTNGVTVNAGPTDTVILRGMEIDGLGTGLAGIKFIAGAKLVVEHSTIQNFTQNGIDFDPAAASALLVVSDSTINNNVPAAIQIFPASPGSANVTISRTRMLQDTYGLFLKGGVTSVRDSVISGATLAGAKAFGTTASVQLTIDDSIVSDNLSPSVGVISQGSLASVFLSRTVITNNGTGFLIAGGTLSSTSDNRIFGNTNLPASSMTAVAQQ